MIKQNFQLDVYFQNKNDVEEDDLDFDDSDEEPDDEAKKRLSTYDFPMFCENEIKALIDNNNNISNSTGVKRTNSKTSMLPIAMSNSESTIQRIKNCSKKGNFNNNVNELIDLRTRPVVTPKNLVYPSCDSYNADIEYMNEYLKGLPDYSKLNNKLIKHKSIYDNNKQQQHPPPIPLVKSVSSHNFGGRFAPNRVDHPDIQPFIPPKIEPQPHLLQPQNFKPGLQKSFSNSCVNSNLTLGKQYLNDFWLKNSKVMKINQIKPTWNYNKIMSKQDEEDYEQQDNFKLRKNYSIPELNQQIKRSKEELYKLEMSNLLPKISQKPKQQFDFSQPLSKSISYSNVQNRTGQIPSWIAKQQQQQQIKIEPPVIPVIKPKEPPLVPPRSICKSSSSSSIYAKPGYQQYYHQKLNDQSKLNNLPTCADNFFIKQEIPRPNKVVVDYPPFTKISTIQVPVDGKLPSAFQSKIKPRTQFDWSAATENNLISNIKNLNKNDFSIPEFKPSNKPVIDIKSDERKTKNHHEILSAFDPYYKPPSSSHVIKKNESDEQMYTASAKICLKTNPTNFKYPLMTSASAQQLPTQNNSLTDWTSQTVVSSTKYSEKSNSCRSLSTIASEVAKNIISLKLGFF